MVSALGVLSAEGLIGLLLGVAMFRWVEVLSSGLAAEGNARPQGELGPWNLESCLGVWKELRKKFGDVGVLVGVGGSPPG